MSELLEDETTPTSRKWTAPKWFSPMLVDRRWLHVLLFLTTLASTTIAWGPWFASAFLAILMTHEMGHYLAARRWGVAVSLPFFIPFPPLLYFPFLGGATTLGTLGAVIRIRSRIPNRKALSDIGAAGPLAGFVVAVIALYVGFDMSEVVAKADAPPGSWSMGDSILSALVAELAVGQIPQDHDVVLHPVAFAGWLGLFVTFINLLPVGQLDGGHIVYALFGNRIHETISQNVAVLLLVVWVLGPPHDYLIHGEPFAIIKGWFGGRWTGWLIWTLIVMILGRRHPPTYDVYSTLNPARKAIGVLSIVVFVICFVPHPFRLAP